MPLLRSAVFLPEVPQRSRVDVVPVSKIFPNHAFGYATITVERPLRLRFESTEESFARLEVAIGGKKVPAAQEIDGVGSVLKFMVDRDAMPTRRDAIKVVTKACKDQNITLTPWMRKTLWTCIEHRDPNGEVQLQGGDKPEPDSELRDTENVPLSEDIEAYFTREVLPHAPDAWIDASKTKIGYEVPFNRHFYTFKPPRELATIDKDLQEVSAHIMSALGGLSK